MRSIRVTLAKKGRAKYLSHLDMQRCMMRAVRRAHIKLWYTEGFNPHPYVTFALPLPLGIESESEPVEIRLEGDASNEDVFHALSAVMPEGIEVLSVQDSTAKPNEIAFAQYRILLQNVPGLAEQLRKALASGELPAEKLGKAGHKKAMKQINCCDLIGSVTLEETGEMIEMNAVLAAGSQKNLSPLLLLDALSAKTGETISYSSLVRKCLLKSDYTKF